MGQGTLTGLAQLVADELDADWRMFVPNMFAPDVNLAASAPGATCPPAAAAAFAASVDYVRKGGAVGPRHADRRRHAQRWEVPAPSDRPRSSVVTHKPSGRRCAMASIAADAAKLHAADRRETEDAGRMDADRPRREAAGHAGQIIRQALFAIDVQLPDMLNAAIAQCPVFGGKLKSFDADRIRRCRACGRWSQVGRQHGRGRGRQVLQAKTALAALPIVWDEGPNATSTARRSMRFCRSTGLDATEAGARSTARRRSPQVCPVPPKQIDVRSTAPSSRTTPPWNR